MTRATTQEAFGMIREAYTGACSICGTMRRGDSWKKGKEGKFFLSLGEKLWAELLIIIIRAKAFANEFGTVGLTVPIRLAKCNYL